MDPLKGYEIALDRVDRMSERRQTSTQIYLAVNTGILGILALLLQANSLRGWGFFAAALPLLVAGIAACLVWERIIAHFRAIIGWHYEKLRAIEQVVPDCHQVCTAEWEALYRPQAGRERFSFSRLESWLPRLFIALYAVYFAGLLLAAAAGWK